VKRAIGLIAITALAQDPSAMLQKARDKMLAEIPNHPRIHCVETIDRSYFSRRSLLGSPASCERLSGDRKQGRAKLRLDATDRLRVEVAVTQGTEMLFLDPPGVIFLQCGTNPAIRTHWNRSFRRSPARHFQQSIRPLPDSRR